MGGILISLNRIAKPVRPTNETLLRQYSYRCWHASLGFAWAAGASAEPAAKSISKHAKAHISKKVVASKAKSKSSTVAKSTVVPLPDRNPAAPANPPPQTEGIAPAPQDTASLPSPAPLAIQQAVADPAMPLPDLNPRGHPRYR